MEVFLVTGLAIFMATACFSCLHASTAVDYNGMRAQPALSID